MFIESMAVGLIGGAACYSQFSQVLPIYPAIEWILLLGLLAGLYYIGRLTKNNARAHFFLLAMLLSFVFELLWANHKAQAILSWQLPPLYQNQVVELKGRVSGIPNITTQTQEVSFVLFTQELCLTENHTACETLKKPQKIKLFGQLSFSKNQTLHPGDFISVKAKLKRPWGASNPGGYDAEKNFFLNQIKATGTIKQWISHQPYTENNFGYAIDNIRQKISDNMLTSLNQDELSGMLIGLTIGVGDKITSEQWSLLRQTGTTHLIAISGLHISLIGGLIFGCMSFFWRRVPRLLLWVPAKIAAAYVTLFFTWAYGFLAGMSVATERACLMMSVLMLAIIFKLRISAGFVYALSLVMILLWDPFSVLSMGFWLSYIAIGILIFATGNRIWFTAQSSTSKYLQPQWAAFIGMLPISLYFFQSASLLSPIVNLIAIPWVSFVVTPVCLFSAFAFMVHLNGLGEALIVLAKGLYFPLWKGMEWIVSFFPMVWHFALPSGTTGLGWFAVSMLGAGILLLPKGVPYKKRVGSGLFAALLFYQPVQLQSGEFQFGLLDVGQGLASVVFTQNHVLIYDVGPKWKERDSGSQVIMPYLAYYHRKNVDAVIISHTDLDHRGGLDSVLSIYPVKHILTSEVERLIQKTYAKPARPIQPVLCQAGQSWVWDGVAFEMLHPSADAMLSEKNRNNLSCVLKISTGKSSLLLTGDIEAGAEKALLNHYKADLAAEILVAPHHGSKTSSTFEFVQAVQPKYVLFPTGKDNRFGFPKQVVVDQYQKLGSYLYNTAEQGAILFTVTPEEVSEPIVWREQQRRFWH